jgi:AAA domain
MGAGWGWRRPGKTDPGISATTGQATDGTDRLYVFSTSTEFEAERPYTKFAAYALLNHGGSYSDAARALLGLGYGQPAADVDLSWIDHLPAEPAPGLRVVPEPEPRRTIADELAADRLLAEMVGDMMRRDRAREILAEVRERTHPKPPADAGTVAELLARPEMDVWRIERLLPGGGRMLFTAQRKTGKTTAVGNLARSLLTGAPFLGSFHTNPIRGRIVVLNYEVTGQTFARWMDDAGIPGDRMYVLNLRGCANPLATEAGREELAATVREVGGEILVVDPFGRAYTGKDQNDAALITPWLVSLDRVAEQSGCAELILTAHAGWNGERTRGSSALEDWPDVIVTMTKDAETGQRYIKAEGRDVDIDEDRLDYHDNTRTYTLTGEGGKAGAAERRKLDVLVAALVDVVTRNPGMGVRAIARAWREEGVAYTNGDEVRASREAVDRGLVTIRGGANNARLHFPNTSTTVPPSVSGVSADTPRVHPDSSVSGCTAVYPIRVSSVPYRDGDTGGDTSGANASDTPAAGICAKCRKPNSNRYGVGGSPLCADCRASA